FSQIQGLLNTAGFPPVFAELEPAPGVDVALPSDPAVQAAVKAAQASTVRIEGTGCGGIQTGSGFVVASGLVVTNAHVVAGIDRPFIEDSKGQHRATTILFDPDLDLAILSARGLAGKPLNLAQQERPPGDGGAVLGYPGGGAFTAVPAAIVNRMEAVGRDIYSRSLSTRDVYRLKANVRPGNSGGPVVAPDGQVTGVVFSRSAYREEIGYALTSISVIPKVNQANQSDREVDTGPCAA
ncbi:MAG TPA: trypsin-like peptidase domain-containing protein, partial [Actinomycetota bacterium]|nr:trypsin-like peptidase domain-containing protein [Actinomycetota bacterium]